MSSGNGARLRALVDAPLLPRPLKSAEMSATQRNATLDDLIETVNTNARVLKELRERHEGLVGRVVVLETELRELVSRFVGQRGLKARLRWLLTGR